MKNLKPLESTNDIEDPTCTHKFKATHGRGEWYVIEGERQKDGDYLFFGFVRSPLGAYCDECGMFTLNELKSVQVPIKIGDVVIDIIEIRQVKDFKPMKLSEVRGE